MAEISGWAESVSGEGELRLEGISDGRRGESGWGGGGGPATGGEEGRTRIAAMGGKGA